MNELFVRYGGSVPKRSHFTPCGFCNERLAPFGGIDAHNLAVGHGGGGALEKRTAHMFGLLAGRGARIQ